MNNEDFLRERKLSADSQALHSIGSCEICGEDDPYAIKLFEKHHISTRAYSNETIKLCLNCHACITQLQNKFEPNARSRKLPIEKRIPYIFASHLALISRINRIDWKLLQEWCDWQNKMSKEVKK